MNETRDVERELRTLACWAGQLADSREAPPDARERARELRDTLVSLVVDLRRRGDVG